MRRWVSTVMVLAALAFVPAVAAADTAALYNDYARDRVLSCRYSRADLRAVLTDASLNQYGDPYTVIGLKLAVRKQLAGSCGRSGQPSSAPTSSERDGDGWGGEHMLAVGAGVLLLVLGTGGWAARRALMRKR